MWKLTLTNECKNGVMIGLEIHIQVTKVKTKLFCDCPSDYRGKPPNTHVCPVCLGLPGALPVPNKKVIEKALLASLALNMDIAEKVFWARKHYFYPDLPKNYQITQYDGKGTTSLAKNGWLDIEVNGRKKRIRIRRINIEEDPGRIVYPTGNILTSRYVLVDYNRSGIPLLEIVTEPDFTNEKEVSTFLKKLRSIMEHLEVSDFSLEGSMRIDANISVCGGNRVEVKNIGSISDVEDAIRYEIVRQKDLVSKGGEILQETRHWDASRKITVSMRVKETEEDYRYMPDPNLPPLPLTDEFIEELKKQMPELPDARAKRYIKTHGMNEYLASIIVSRKALSDYYEKVSEISGIKGDRLASYIVNDLLGWVPEEDPNKLWELFPPEIIAETMRLLVNGKITIKMAKEMIPFLKEGKSPSEIIEEKKWIVVSDERVLEAVVKEVFRENKKAVEDAKKNKRAIQFLVGKVMEKTGKRADPKKVFEIIVRLLEKD